MPAVGVPVRRVAALALGVGALAALGWFALRPPPALDAELFGFRYRLADGRPVFDAEALPTARAAVDGLPRVRWLPEDGAPVTAEVRAEPDDPALWRTAWGAIAPGPGTLEIAYADGRRRWPARWSQAPGRIEGLDRVVALREDGRLDEAARALAAVDRRRFEVDLWAGVEAARLAVAAGRGLDAAEVWGRAAADATRLGIATEAARRYRAAAFVAYRHRRVALMLDWMSRAAALDDPQRDPTGHARLAHLQGQLGMLIDDWRAARAAYEAAIERARRVGDRNTAWLSAEALALLTADLGAAADGLERLSGAASMLDGADGATRARYALNLGWLTLRALPDAPTAADVAELRARLDAGRRSTEAEGNPFDTANAAVNQAWGALETGDLETAEARLDEARALDPQGAGYAAPYAALLQARVDLARGRLEAADTGFARLEARARREQGETSELAWRAVFGQGRVARARGDVDGARGHFDRALAIVDALGRRAALRGDRATFHADRSALVDEAIALTVEREPWRAFGYADAARARPMRALQADLRVGALDAAGRRRWAEALDAARAAADAARAAHRRLEVAPVAEESARRRDVEAAERAREAAFDGAYAVLDDATPAPAGIDGAALSRSLAADEVVFAFHGPWSFRVDARGAAARRTSTDDPLGDWRTLPPTVRHVYVVPGGHPGAFRLATAGAAPLLDRATVSFLPYAGLLQRPPTPATGPPLVVADPRLDLAFAAAEGRAVADSLAEARLLTGAEATRDAVLDGLARARLFHFAGHGVLHPERPWDAHLRLAGEATLSLSDLLTHPVGAAVVVLSGCETGVDAVLLDEAVVGLPEAFLAAGAGSVLATDRPVDDRITRRFVERFYAADGASKPAQALRRAAREARSAGEPAWDAFRLVGLRAAPGR